MSRRRGKTRGGAMPTAEQARQAMDDNQGLIPFRRGVEIEIGDLSGEVVQPLIATFGYFGKRFRVNPDLTETMVVDLLEAGESIGVEDPRQLVAAKDYVRDHIHEDDFDDFWQTAVDNRQGMKDVIRLCWKLLEQVTDRPTTPPSDSSDGRPDTPTNSPGGASGQVIESTATPAPAPVGPAVGNLEAVAQHFVTKYEEAGRPDLACQIMLAKESREARGLVTV